MVYLHHRIKLFAVFDETVLVFVFYVGAYRRKTRQQLSTSPGKPFAFHHIITVDSALFDQSGSSWCACADYTYAFNNSSKCARCAAHDQDVSLFCPTKLYTSGHHKCLMYEPVGPMWLTELLCCSFVFFLLFLAYFGQWTVFANMSTFYGNLIATIQTLQGIQMLLTRDKSSYYFPYRLRQMATSVYSVRP